MMNTTEKANWESQHNLVAPTIINNAPVTLNKTPSVNWNPFAGSTCVHGPNIHILVHLMDEKIVVKPQIVYKWE